MRFRASLVHHKILISLKKEKVLLNSHIKLLFEFFHVYIYLLRGAIKY
jgi:hypothetical protein